MRILFWIGIVMLMDAGVAMLGLNYWQRLAPAFNVRRIALAEAFLALTILLVYYFNL